MAAKELKALIDVGVSLGYSGDELKQFLNDERMRMDREKKEINWRRKTKKENELRRRKKRKKKWNELKKKRTRKSF